MALDLRSIAVDPDKVSKGSWVDFMGAKFLVARYNNREAEAARAVAMHELYTELMKKEEPSDQDQKKLQDIQVRVMADHVLLGWKNLSLDGKTLKYSHDKAYEILSNEEFQDLYNFVWQESFKRENFVNQQDQEITKDVKSTANS